MKFTIVDKDGALLAEHETGRETLEDFLISYYPPEFCYVSKLDPQYGPYGVPNCEGTMIHMPAHLQESVAEPSSWEFGFVVLGWRKDGWYGVPL